MIAELLHTYSGHKDSIYKLVKLNHHEFLSLSGDGMIVKWNINRPELSGEAIARLPVVIYSSVLDSINHQLWVGTRFGSLYLFDFESKKQINHFELSGDVFGIAQSVESVFVVDGGGNLSIIDKKSLKVQTQKIAKESGRCVVVDEPNKTIYTGWSDSYLRVFDYECNLQNEFKAHETSVFSLALNNEGTTLYSGGKDARLRTWDLDTNKEISALNAHWYAIYSLDFNTEGTLLASTSRDKTAKIWALDEQGIPILKSVLRPLIEGGHTHSVNTSIWFDTPTRLVTAGDDRVIRVWEVI